MAFSEAITEAGLSDLLSECLAGRSRGWSYTPLRGKIPRLGMWERLPRESEEDLRSWCAQGNVGLRTGSVSGVLVIDIDSDACPIPLPRTVTAITGGGGRHFYFAAPRSVEIGNRASTIAPGVDVRGEGGQVVAVGSVHPKTGALYEWAPCLSPSEAPLEEFPLSMLATREKKWAAAALEKERREVADAAEGSRNHTLNKAAFSVSQIVAAGHLDEREARAALLEAAVACGLYEHEAARTIESGFRAGSATPRSPEGDAPPASKAPESIPSPFALATPRSAPESERIVVACCVNSHEVAAQVREIVPDPSLLRDPSLRAVYAACLEMEAAGGYDAESLATRCGKEEVSSLSALAWGDKKAVRHARIVAAAAHIRDLRDAATRLLRECETVDLTDEEKTRALREEAERSVMRVSAAHDRASTASAADLAAAFSRRVASPDDASRGRVWSGFKSVDRLIGGFRPGEMIVLAARPGTGKTAIACNIAEAASGGVFPTPVMFFELEMTRDQLYQRMLAAKSGVDSERIRDGSLAESEARRVEQANGELSRAPLYIDDQPSLTVSQLRTRARRAVSRWGAGLIVVDYLQIMRTDRRIDDRRVEVGEISKAVKALAKELRVPVLCLAQLGRPAAGGDGRPRMSNLRESGDIEQEADVVALLWRESDAHKADPEWIAENEDRLNVTEVIVDKNRNGRTGVAELEWIPSRVRFVDRREAK